ncbi:helix-turn-helix domain-containing protein [Saccharopolyspora sp. NPDC003762]
MKTDLASAIADLMHQLQAEQVRGYRVETVAGLLDVPYRTVMALIHSGQLGHVMAGRYYLVPHVELQRYLAGAAAVPGRNDVARGPVLITTGP